MLVDAKIRRQRHGSVTRTVISTTQHLSSDMAKSQPVVSPTNPPLRSHHKKHVSEMPRSKQQAGNTAPVPELDYAARKQEHKKYNSSSRNSIRHGKCESRSSTLAVGGRGGREQKRGEEHDSQQPPHRHRHPRRFPATRELGTKWDLCAREKLGSEWRGER